MGLNNKVKLDIDGDGKPDLNLDLKTMILVIGGIISITMTYSALTKQIELNKSDDLFNIDRSQKNYSTLQDTISTSTNYIWFK